MTISVDGNPQHYTGDGTNASLNTVFFFFTSTDIIVTQRVTATGAEAVLTMGTHYSVTGGSAAGAVGTVEVTDGATDFLSTVTWTLQRAVPLTQTLDYVANDLFPAASHESGMDRLTTHSQDVDARMDRAIITPVTELSSVSLELPNSVDRAGKALTFTSTGAVTASTVTSVGYGKVLLDSVSTLSDTTVTLDASDWTATYDRVEIEIRSWSLATGNGVPKIEPILAGSATSSNLHSNAIRMQGAVHGLTQPTDWTLGSHDAGVDDGISGTITIFHTGSGYIKGTGSLTYGQGSAPTYLNISVQYTATTSSTWDGFSFTHSGGAFAANLRLWGHPRL